MSLANQQNQKPLFDQARFERIMKKVHRKSIYETNFDRIEKLGFLKDGKPVDYAKSLSSGYMDLVLEALPHWDNYQGKAGYALSMVHYFEQNGDLCQDPEMVILIHPEQRMVEALTWQSAMPPVYQEVYPSEGMVDLRAKKEQNAFLRTWLNNLIEQGHGKNWAELN